MDGSKSSVSIPRRSFESASRVLRSRGERRDVGTGSCVERTSSMIEMRCKGVMSLNVDRVWGTERCNSNEDDDVGTCSRRKFIRSSRSVTLRSFVYSRVTGENVISAKNSFIIKGKRHTLV